MIHSFYNKQREVWYDMKLDEIYICIREDKVNWCQWREGAVIPAWRWTRHQVRIGIL